MKEKILVSTVILLVMGGLVQAQDSELHGSIDVTYLSKYVWRGFDIYQDKSAIQPSLDVNLFGTGLGINVMGHRANSDGFEEGERWDYTFYYGHSLFEDESFATMCRLGWVYYNYPQNSSGIADLQELQAVFSMPKILSVKGLVPTYVLVKLWPSESGSMVGSRSPLGGTASGFAHIFMLDYGLTISGLLPETPEQTVNFHSEFVFNDGVGPNGANVDHDWSNAVFGVSTGFNLADNIVLTPGVYHQITMDSSVNDDKDETWATLGMTYKF